MRIFYSLIFGIFIFFGSSLNAQNTINDHKGLLFGVSVGGGSLHLNTNDTQSNAFCSSLPNIKIGYFLHPQFAVLALLPGSTYKYQGADRGFEGFLLGGQYWIKDNWWLMACTGLTFDAAAFYTVKDPAKAGFYTGFPAVALGSGVKLYGKGRFEIDMQYRLFYGNSNLENDGYRKGLANVLLIGFNWY